MALTYTQVAKLVQGNSRSNIVDIVADATYTASGYVLTTADYAGFFGSGLPVTTTDADSRIVLFNAVPNAANTTCVYDKTNLKLLFFVGGSEATTTISSKTVRVEITHGVANKGV